MPEVHARGSCQSVSRAEPVIGPSRGLGPKISPLCQRKPTSAARTPVASRQTTAPSPTPVAADSASCRHVAPFLVLSQPSKELVTVPNPEKGRDYEILCETDELTCICPVTGQPDFATVRITYVPDEFLVELKSLKMYIWSYRDEGAFHEAVTNTILDDLVRVLSPRRMTVETVWKVRGGVLTTVTASHP